MSDPGNPIAWIISFQLVQTVFLGVIVYGMQKIIDLLERRDE